MAIVLFDRTADALEVIDSYGMRANHAWFGVTLDHYLRTLDLSPDPR